MSSNTRRLVAEHHASCKAKNVALARQVSAALRSAGLVKASPYKTFGREGDGFQVAPSTIVAPFPEAHVPACTVLFTDDRSTARRSEQSALADVQARAVAAIRAAGLRFSARESSWSIEVTR